MYNMNNVLSTSTSSFGDRERNDGWFEVDDGMRVLLFPANPHFPFCIMFYIFPLAPLGVYSNRKRKQNKNSKHKKLHKFEHRSHSVRCEQNLLNLCKSSVHGKEACKARTRVRFVSHCEFRLAAPRAYPPLPYTETTFHLPHPFREFSQLFETLRFRVTLSLSS